MLGFLLLLFLFKFFLVFCSCFAFVHRQIFPQELLLLFFTTQADKWTWAEERHQTDVDLSSSICQTGNLQTLLYNFLFDRNLSKMTSQRFLSGSELAPLPERVDTVWPSPILQYTNIDTSGGRWLHYGWIIWHTPVLVKREQKLTKHCRTDSRTLHNYNC